MLGPHLEKDPNVVQSLGDSSPNVIGEKRYCVIIFICIFLLVSLRIFSYSYWSFNLLFCGYCVLINSVFTLSNVRADDK